MSDTATAAKTEAKRRSKFLVVVDDTQESRVALRYATRRARNIRCGVVLLRVVEPVDFQQWAGVAEIMRSEAHEAAERSEEHQSELQSLMRISYAVFCL